MTLTHVELRIRYEPLRNAKPPLGLLCILLCSGCGDIIEGFVFLAAMVILFAIFATAILAVSVLHMVFAVRLGKPPHRPKTFGWIAAAWLLISIGGVIAIWWLQREFTRIHNLEYLYIVPASTVAVSLLAAYTWSRLDLLASEKSQSSPDDEQAQNAAAEPSEAAPAIGAALRVANIVVAALPTVAEVLYRVFAWGPG